MRALIVEDDKTTQRLLAGMVGSFGEFDLASNGEDAFIKFQRASTMNEAYSIVFLDCQMPDVDGIEFLNAVRQVEAQQGKVGDDGVHVVVVTGGVEQSQLHELLTARCASFIQKPICRQRVQEEIEKVIAM